MMQVLCSVAMCAIKILQQSQNIKHIFEIE